MEKIDHFTQVLHHLKAGEKIIHGVEDYFLLKQGKVIHYQKGNRYCLSLSLFEKLFSQEEFYLHEDYPLEIDELKDEEYYRHYQK